MPKQKITIPEGWRKENLGDIAVIKNGKTNTQDAVVDGEYPLFDRSVAIKRSNKFLFDAEAVILPGEGAEFVPRYFKGKFDLHQRAYAILPNEKNVASKYLYYFLCKFNNILLKNAVGSTVKSLRLPIIQKMSVLLPSLAEQQKISEILCAVDEDIEKTEKIIEQTEKLKKGLMQELFTKGIGHIKFKKTKLGEVPSEWEIKDFITVATLQRGYDLPANKRIGGIYPLASSNGITDSHNEFKVEGPGVFTGRSGTLGNIFYIEKNYWPLNTTLYVKDFHGNNGKFIYYFLQMMNLREMGTGTGVPTLNRNIVHSKKIAVPKFIDEQKQIADILSGVDDQIDIYKKLKLKLTELKKGLMQDLLSGITRVNI